jgi:hypothetical protein
MPDLIRHPRRAGDMVSGEAWIAGQARNDNPDANDPL